MMWVGLGLLLEEKSAFAEAREAYRAALEVGAHPEAQLGLAWCAVVGGVGDGEEEREKGRGEALVHAWMAYAQRPGHVQGAALLGELLLSHARWVGVWLGRVGGWTIIGASGVSIYNPKCDRRYTHKHRRPQAALTVLEAARERAEALFAVSGSAVTGAVVNEEAGRALVLGVIERGIAR
jgi:hypothetical protein